MAEIFPVKSASFLLDFASCSAATALCSVMSTPQVMQILVGVSVVLHAFGIPFSGSTLPVFQRYWSSSNARTLTSH